MPDQRFDNRTKEEFSRDIKQLSLVEAEIALRLCIWYKENKGIWPTLTPTGTGFTGEYTNKASSRADFKIANTNIEITHSANFCKKTFHEKTDKVVKCLSGEHVIIFVNGFQQFVTPSFVYIRPTRMQQLAGLSLAKYGFRKMPARGTSTIVNKEAYRFDIGFFKETEWYPLPKLIKMPKQYDEIVGLLNGKA